MNFTKNGYVPTRKAILIGSPSKGKRFLPGVKQDLANVRFFLESDNAGRWFPREIITLNNPSFEKVIQEIHSTSVDYLFVYFSGHGGTLNGDGRVLELNNALISDLDLLNTCPRQLIICDACSNHIKASIGRIPEYSDENFNFDGTYEARELFNQYIMNSPHGKVIVHSSQIGEYSYDSSDGGVFTQALLTVSTQIKTSQDYIPYSLLEMLQLVPAELQRNNNKQVPTIFAKGDLRVPFVFGMQRKARISAVQRFVAQNSPTNQPTSNEGLMLFGLSLFVLALIVGNK